jgi:hypothetical protein
MEEVRMSYKKDSSRKLPYGHGHSERSKAIYVLARRDGLARVLCRTSFWVSVFVKYMITWLVPVSHPHCTHDHPGGNTSPEMEAKRQHRIIRIIYACSFTCASRTCRSRNLNTCNQWRLLCLRVTSITFHRYAHLDHYCATSL